MEVIQFLVQSHLQVVEVVELVQHNQVVHIQAVVQVDLVVVQEKINLILEVMVINHPYHQHKEILVVMVVEVVQMQDLPQEAVELEEQVDQYKEHLQIQKEVLVVLEYQQI
tara:strand:+ start:95 stop:427 length:333 start_codon:yes stop_codon:yes gene_type:complete